MLFSVLFLSARFECILASPDIVWFLTCIASFSLGLSAHTKHFSVFGRAQTFEARVKRIGGGGGQGAGKSYLQLSSFPLLPFFFLILVPIIEKAKRREKCCERAERQRKRLLRRLSGPQQAR